MFDAEPPMPVPYDFINRVGETKKMSKSAGDVVTVKGALEIMPAEIVRFFILKSMPSRALYFDQGVGLFNLIDEYAKIQQAVKAGEDVEFKEAYLVASAQTREQTISTIGFGHLVQCYQAARRDDGRTLELLERSGYEDAVKREREVIIRELRFVGNWLDKYAPESVKFNVQSAIPDVTISEEQGEFLRRLVLTVQAEQNLNGQGMHDAIYAAATESGLKPSEAFVVLYRLILGQDRGPKAGWFLASLDHEWLVKRLLLKE
jgi:lysyl-tRNA synthetase class 1